MCKVSIVVPVYNAEKYLSKCIESLMHQTLKNIEIILVNDGSKDESLVICKRYAKEDSRIKVIDQKNQGVSIARNNGIEASTGEYIGFADPDDWVEEVMYENMLGKLVCTDTDICFCNYYKDAKKSRVGKCFKFKDEVLDKQGIKDNLLAHMIGIDDLMPKYTYVMGSVWRCLYKKSFIETYKLRFVPGISIMEDLIFSVAALLKCEKVCVDHGLYYHYVQNPKSILHSHNKKMWQDEVSVQELLEALVQEAGLEEEMRNRLDMRYIGMAFLAMRNETYLGGKKKIKPRLEMIRQICTDEKLKITLERIKPIQPLQKASLFDKQLKFIKSNIEKEILRK